MIENFYPCLGAPNYLIKRVVDEPLDVFADVFTDGHVILRAVLKWRLLGASDWTEAEMRPLENDRWQGQCRFPHCGRWEYVVEAWADTWLTWKKHFAARVAAQDADLAIEAREGAKLLEQAAAKAAGEPGLVAEMEALAGRLRAVAPSELGLELFSEEVLAAMLRHSDRSLSTISPATTVSVERVRARFSAWYEFFPRGAAGLADTHSTFRDCVARLDDAQAMGFDVVYFPPIHPIGVTNRKGKNNTLTTVPGDVGSPWAIGSTKGGHRCVEPSLGTNEDFEWLVHEARLRGLEVALDFAINCSPDHPYVKDHPNWFYQREDGSIRYAENPPKKYQDIYPLNFHCDDWRSLWRELTDVVLFWVDRGVRIFRVDNPHTKPVAFWEGLIAEVQAAHPDVLFLSEAFTRPRMMQVLGKIGFSQSYSYFTWRESKHELTAYVEELTQSEMRWYYRANFWPNTPDILPHHLQNQGPAIFKIRAALAALLCSNWGIYSGYELCESAPLPGREEYLDSEKFQLVNRDWNAPGNIKGFLSALNRARRENEALQHYDKVRFHHAEHYNVIAFSKVTPDFSNRVLVIINLDPSAAVAGLVHLDMNALGLAGDANFGVRDLIHGACYRWSGAHNYVALDPGATFMHLFLIEP
ncbi:MAG: alpha-1,4-glucan--maltose-1-phosphate maltosyltransferase [Roseimicrobium sp.]